MHKHKTVPRNRAPKCTAFAPEKRDYYIDAHRKRSAVIEWPLAPNLRSIWIGASAFVFGRLRLVTRVE